MERLLEEGVAPSWARQAEGYPGSIASATPIPPPPDPSPYPHLEKLMAHMLLGSRDAVVIPTQQLPGRAQRGCGGVTGTSVIWRAECQLSSSLGLTQQETIRADSSEEEARATAGAQTVVSEVCFVGVGRQSPRGVRQGQAPSHRGRPCPGEGSATQ